MSARFILSAAVGGVAGVSGGPALGFQAFSLTYGATGFLDPAQKVQGPRLDDVKAPTAAYGAVIPYIEGHPRVAGNLVWCTDKREIATTTSSGGKGGPGTDITTYAYEVDCMFFISENAGRIVRKIFSNGALIWTAADDADEDSSTASDETISWREMRGYDGAFDQLPDTTYEAAIGVGLAPAYRGRSSVVFEGLNLGSSGQFPVLTFEITTGSATTQESFTEDFTASFPSEYTDMSGGVADAFIDTGPWGNFLNIPGNLAWPDIPTGQIRRNVGLEDTQIQTIEFNFRIELPWGDITSEPWPLENIGNTPTLELWTVSSGLPVNRIFMFYAAEMYYVDDGHSGRVQSNHSPHVQLGSSLPKVELLPYALPIETWLKLKVSIIGTNLCRLVLTNIATGAVIVDRELASQGSWSPGMLIFSRHIGYGMGLNFDKLSAVSGGSFDQIKLGSSGASIELTEPALREVMKAQWERASLDPALLDADAGADIPVHSLAVSQITSPRQIMDMLASAHLMEFVESGAGVRMVARGGAPVATIPWDDLGASVGDAVAEPLPLVRGNELETPAQWSVKFSNIDDDYRDGNESSARFATGSSIVTMTELPIGLTPTEAKQLAEILVTDAIASLIRVGPVALTRKYAALEPTDVVLLTGRSGSTYRVRLLKKTEADGLLTFDGVLDDASAVTSDATTSGGYNNTTLVRIVPETAIALLDIPILRDADNDPGYYAAMRGTAAQGWRGATLSESLDDVTYSEVGSVRQPAIFGTALTVLGDWTGGAVFDELNSVTVDMVTGALASAYREDLLESNINAMLIGDEIVQFRSASPQSASTYILTGLIRGKRGTEWAVSTHVADERAVLLGDSGTLRVARQTSELGVPRYHRAQSVGKPVEAAISQSITPQAIGLRPFSPVNLRASRNGNGDLIFTWNRRTRMASRFVGTTGINVPLGEASEAYELEIWTTDFTRLLRTLTATIPTVVYSGDMQVEDSSGMSALTWVRVYQISATVGRGVAHSATIETGEAASPGVGQIRTILVIGATVYASDVNTNLVSTDGGATFTTALHADGAGWSPWGALKHAYIGTHRLQIDRNEYANAASVTTGTTDASVPTAWLQNDPVSERWYEVGYPREAISGVPLRVGGLYSDGTYYYVVARLANLSQPYASIYLYRAGTDLAFTLQGEMTLDPSDPNAFTAANDGVWAGQTVSNYAALSYYCQITKIAGRWFINSGMAMYYTDEADGLTNWARCPINLPGEDSTSHPVFPYWNSEVFIASSYLLIIGYANNVHDVNFLAVSADNGETWTRSAPLPSGRITRMYGVIGNRVFLYYRTSPAVMMVAYADAPYSTWTHIETSGVPWAEINEYGYQLSDLNYLTSTGGGLCCKYGFDLLFSSDGIAFIKSIIT